MFREIVQTNTGLSLFLDRLPSDDKGFHAECFVTNFHLLALDVGLLTATGKFRWLCFASWLHPHRRHKKKGN
jgi:hypothetical protein